MDTLDILMMYEDNKDIVTDIWVQFVDAVTSQNGKIIWTCHGESFYYEGKLIEKENEYIRVDLPPIDKQKLREFTNLKR